MVVGNTKSGSRLQPEVIWLAGMYTGRIVILLGMSCFRQKHGAASLPLISDQLLFSMTITNTVSRVSDGGVGVGVGATGVSVASGVSVAVTVGSGVDVSLGVAV